MSAVWPTCPHAAEPTAAIAIPTFDTKERPSSGAIASERPFARNAEPQEQYHRKADNAASFCCRRPGAKPHRVTRTAVPRVLPALPLRQHPALRPRRLSPAEQHTRCQPRPAGRPRPTRRRGRPAGRSESHNANRFPAHPLPQVREATDTNGDQGALPCEALKCPAASTSN